MLNYRKSIMAFAVVGFLLLSISAPALSTAAKTPPVQLKSPQNIVVTPVAPGGNFTVSWSVVPNASSYTVRVYNSSGKTLVGPAITLAVSVQTVTRSINTSYRVSVQAIGNGSTYSNSPESGKYSLTTFASTYAITWNDSCPDGINTCTTSSSGGASTYVITSAVTTIPTTAPAAVGYTFDGWWVDSTFATGSAITSSYTPASPYGAITFYAKWSANTDNAITWDNQSPTTASSGGSSVYTTAAAVATIPTVDPIKTGYSFGGWFTQTAGAGTQVTNGFYTPASPYGAITFYAKWSADTDNAITWDDQSPTTASSGGSTTYTTGLAVTTIRAVDPIKTGYSFGGWFTQTAGAGTQVTNGSYTPASPYGAITFYAKWSAALPPFTTSPTYALSASPTVGSPVTATPTGVWSPSSPTLHYQWLQSDDGINSWINVTTNSDSASYSPIADDLGKYLQVVVTASAAGYANSVVSSTASEIVAAASTPVCGSDGYRTGGGSNPCQVGDTGPAGGIIYYYSAGGFNCGAEFTETGSPTGGLCHYLEVAPDGWTGSDGDPRLVWAIYDYQESDITVIASEDPVYNNALGIGLGYKNSIAILAQGNDMTTAAGAARAYAGGSKSDWYLPTAAELNLLCQWNRGVTQDVIVACTGGAINSGTGAAGFVQYFYWSSSEYDEYTAWSQGFNNGYQAAGGKYDDFHVRPVRAF